MAGSSLVCMATGQPSTRAPFIMMRLVGMVLAVAWSAPTPRPPPAKGVLVQPTMQYLTLSHHYITGVFRLRRTCRRT